MPRPGPRPYECVRRAWHSERHQPIRGSVIQQIFRLVHETHAAQTKRNREWQQKLPFVVIKAEEIIYSKANSEAEYMNLDTLWDRVNDAINTIIRRDESGETGELLPPCVEAALTLGCFPVRASRSQRHNNPRTYLNLRPQESSAMPTRTIDEQCPKLPAHNSENQLNFVRSTSNAISTPQASESNLHGIKNDNLPAHQSYPLYENVLPAHNTMIAMEPNYPLNLGSVYPLYYGTHYQTQGSQIPDDVNSTPIFVGKPVGTSIPESAEMGALPNLISCPSSDMALKTVTQPDFGDNYKMPLVTGCDLSLRLGLSSDPCMSIDRSSAREAEDVGSSSYQQVNKLSNPSSLINKEFCFFPGKTVNDPSESCSRNWFSEGECYNLEGSTRNHNVPFGDKLEEQCCWQPGHPSNHLIGRIKGPGL